MKIGLYGGTFDPIHTGHLITAQFVKEQRKLDKIVFIPCYISPHKIGVDSASPNDRLSMIKLAIEKNESFTFSDYEIKRGGVSYTFLTLREMKKEINHIELIIGYDNLLVFDKWEKPDEITKLAELIVLNRKPDENIHIKRNRFFDKAIFVNSPQIEISSSLIRERVKSGLSIKYLVPEKVKEYISSYKLYR